MFKYLLSFFTVLLFQIINSQILRPFDNEKCGSFSYSVKAKNFIKIDYLNDEDFKMFKNKKVELNEIPKEENLKLLIEFKQKFPKIFSDSCATFSFYENNELREVKSCNIKFKLIDKESDFYIFQMSGFEISGYLMYNGKTKLSIFTDAFPQILEDGRYIISTENGLNSTSIQFYKKEEKGYSDYELNISPRFRIKEYYIYKDYFKNLILVSSVTRKSLKLVEEGKNGKKYVFDENNGCNLKIKIEY